jgi:23S rRNA (guanosine2251-2'-O)-methyltransferase
MKRLLLGPRAVTEGLRANAAQIAVVYVSSEGGKGAGEIERLCEQTKTRWEPRERQELDALAGGSRHQGVLAIAGEYSYLSLPELLDTASDRPLWVALDCITDPHNLGAIVRSVVALGADGIITLKDRAAPVTAAVVRVSAGATETARIARVVNLARCLEQLSGRGQQVVGLSADAEQELADLPYPPEGRVLLVGAEGSGLRRLTRLRCDALARIPLSGAVSSLNASVAAAIAIYESVKQRRRAEHGA